MICHKTFRLTICFLENRNIVDPLQIVITRKRYFPQPILPILFLMSTTFSITATIACIVVSMFDRVLFRALIDRVLYRVLSDRFPSRVLFTVPSDKVLFRVLSDKVHIFFFSIIMIYILRTKRTKNN